jgi:hypothetical protein
VCVRYSPRPSGPEASCTRSAVLLPQTSPCGGMGVSARPIDEMLLGETQLDGGDASGSAPHQQLSERVRVVRRAPRRHDASSTAPAERRRTAARVPALCEEPCSGLCKR